MSIFAEQVFDALAAVGGQRLQVVGTKHIVHGSLHTIVGREPLDAPTASVIRDLSQLREQLTTWPYLRFVHPSRILPHLGLCPPETVGYLIRWLPQDLQEIAQKHTGQEPLEMPKHPLVCRFIVKSWSRFLDSLETAPKAFCYTGDMGELLQLKEQEIRTRCHAMALYALEPHLKHFILRDERDRMKVALKLFHSLPAIEFIRFIRSVQQGIPSQLPYSFPMKLWDGTPVSLETLCDKFGFACLGRLIAQKPEEFKRELSLHFSQATWSMIPQVQAEVKPEVLQHLKQSFELAGKFISGVATA